MGPTHLAYVLQIHAIQLIQTGQANTRNGDSYKPRTRIHVRSFRMGPTHLAYVLQVHAIQLIQTGRVNTHSAALGPIQAPVTNTRDKGRGSQQWLGKLKPTTARYSFKLTDVSVFLDSGAKAELPITSPMDVRSHNIQP